MSDFLTRISKLSAKQLMLLADELNSRVESLGRAARQPIAVLGIGCRFPGGADTPDQFWKLLVEGRNGIQEVPLERWDIDRYYDPDPDRPGKMSTRWGGFLAGVDGFDAEFFGISPREAISMDPQQRLALEVAWEAIENAGMSPLDLAGSQTGVYLGLCNADYIKMVLDQSEEAIDAYLATGSAHSIAAGRISYLFDLEGPSIAVDTACSSSLLAVHLACQSLRVGECRMALAGGVNLILTPETTMALSKAHMMSPQGRCKTFDQSADGFVRAEGCGMVLLKRLPDALADGDLIQGVILGSAANQDGRSGGITAPNGPSQTAVIRKALRNAALQPSAVDYIEAHGTGTILGDPIEMRALGEVFGRDRDPERPLWVGSVKTNIGHSESAAGIAGFIKALLCVQYGEIPPHLYFTSPNREIEWDRLPVRIPIERTKWMNAGRPRIAGVSSFGFSGTNAHVLIGPASEQDNKIDAENQSPHPQTILLSALNASALARLADRYADYLHQHPQTHLAAFSRTLAAGRSHFADRAAFVAGSVADARAILEQIAKGKTPSGALRSRHSIKRPPPVAFLFTGQGSQYVGMGRILYHSYPVFRQTLDQCAILLKPFIDHALIDLLFSADEGRNPLNQTQFAQPALFALEYALVTQWKAWGLEPAAVMGHSVGEYVAACVAGIMDLETGLRLIARRGKLMQELAPEGEMAAVAAPGEVVQATIDEVGPGACIAGLNGPRQTVVSGEREAMGRLLETFAARGIDTHRLNVTRAFHSHLMEPALEELRTEFGQVSFQKQQIPIISNLTGSFADPDQMGKADYWYKHTRQPVRFAESLASLHKTGYRHFMEIGPHPVLCLLGRSCLNDPEVAWYHNLARGKDDRREISRCLAEAYVNGLSVKWSKAAASTNDRRLPLPTYPFQRSAYWLDRSAGRRPRSIQNIPLAGHPLIGREIYSPALIERVFEAGINCREPAFLKQHRVLGQWIMPTPAYLEMVHAALAKIGAQGRTAAMDLAITDLQIREALVLPEDELLSVQTVIGSEDTGKGRTCRFFSAPRAESEPKWRLHAECRIIKATGGAPPRPDLGRIKQRCPIEISAEHFYGAVQDLGLEFGELFQGLRHIWKGKDEALGEMSLPSKLEADSQFYHFHPALLDSCFHLLGAALPEENLSQAFLLIGIEHVQLLRKPPKHFWNHTRIRPNDAPQHESVSGDIILFDEAGIIAQYRNLLLRKVRAESLGAVPRSRDNADGLYRLDWVSHPLPRTVPRYSDKNMLRLEETAEKLSSDLMRYGEENGLWVYEALLPQLDRWCGNTIARMLYGKDSNRFAGQQFSLDELSAELRVIPRYKRLLHRMCDILVAEGHIKEEDSGFRLTNHPPETNGSVTPEELLESFPSCAAEIEMTLRCGEHLREVLNGERDPLELLFPRGEVQIAEHIYEKSPYARSFNAIVADAVAVEMDRRHAEGEEVRILEIGGGTGGTTSHVLERLNLPKDRYTFSDISPLFVARAREKYRQYEGVDFKTLDIEVEPDGQGFAGERYDIVICANVLHATNNLKAALDKIHRLLSPGGLLILLEGTAAQAWVDLTFGLTEGWWRFEDTEIRPDYPLMDRMRWRELLSICGFEGAMVAVDGRRSAEVFNQTVILARRLLTDEDQLKIKGTWVLFNDPQGLAEALAKPLALAGAHVETINFKATELDFQAQIAGYLNDIRVRAKSGTVPPLEGLVYFASGAVSFGKNTSGWVPAELTAGLIVMQALVNSETTAKLWICTQGGQVATPLDRDTAPTQASLWGLCRVFGLEYPSRFGGIVDLAVDEDVEIAAARLCVHLATAGDEDQAALRDGRRLVPRIVAGVEGTIPDQPMRPHRDGTYLITGGLGGLGLKVAQWLANLGAGRLLLLSRKALPDKSKWETMPVGDDRGGIIRTLLAIEAKGVQVDLVSADVGDRTAMVDLFERLKGDTTHPLKGIIHAAVVMSRNSIDRLNPDRLDRMFHAKVGGAFLLDEFSRDLSLDFFVLFSSTTSLWGVAGLGHYAAANQVLDLLAHRRRQNGLPAMSINWGTWEQMRVASREDRQAFLEAGLNPMPAKTALDLMGRLMRSDVTEICVASVDWERLRNLYEVRRPRPIFKYISRAAEPQRSTATFETEGLQDRLRALPDQRRRSELVTHLQTRVREVLRLPSGKDVDCEKGFFDMGMDSLMAVELKSRLQTDLAMSLPSTLTFNYPTIEELAGFLVKQLAPVAPFASPQNAGQAPVEEPTILPKEDTLSEDELSELLMRKLKELE